MDLILLLGILAAILTTTAFFPQVVKAHNSRHTKDLSLAMLILFSFGLFLWFSYGLVLNSWPVIVANFITLALNLYLMFLKIKYG